MVHLVALFQAAQDGDGVLFTRLIDLHTLKASLQRRILFDVLTVLVKRSRADAMQFSTSQCRLEHIARVHRALSLAGAYHGVQLVDEQDDPAFLLAQFVEHRLETLFELAAKLRSSDQRPHVQREKTLVL